MDPGELTPLELAIGMRGDRNERFITRLRRREELIQECMSSKGFRYEIGAADAPETSSLSVLNPEQRIQKFGFGLSTQVYEQADLPAGLVGRERSTEPPADPNEAYIQTLDPAGRDAFYEAMTGCLQVANEALSRDYPEMELSEAQQRAFQEVDTLVAADSEVAAAWADVVTCLKDAGFDANVAGQRLEFLVQERLAELMDQTARSSVSALSREWAELQSFEISLAQFALRCGYFTTFTEIKTARFVVVSSHYVAEHEGDF